MTKAEFADLVRYETNQHGLVIGGKTIQPKHLSDSVLQEASERANREAEAALKVLDLHETRLPESSGKTTTEPTPDPVRDAIFGRLGLDRTSYAAPAKKPETIHEAPRDAKVVDGMHQKLAEALGGGSVSLPDDVHLKLANSL